MSAEEEDGKLVEYSSSPGEASVHGEASVLSARSVGMVRTPAGYAMSMDSSSQPARPMPGQQLIPELRAHSKTQPYSLKLVRVQQRTRLSTARMNTPVSSASQLAMVRGLRERRCHYCAVDI